jgi:molybdopterin-biosynthesis enzyme MoeA-like protein
MKKIVRLTESDLARIVKRVMNEQFHSEIDTTPKSGENELKQKLESLKSEMETLLDTLKSSGTEMDAQRFFETGT